MEWYRIDGQDEPMRHRMESLVRCCTIVAFRSSFFWNVRVMETQSVRDKSRSKWETVAVPLKN